MSRLNKKIYILPNIFTSMNALCGFYSIVSSIRGNYVAGAAAVLVAMIFDIMDGRVARMTNSESRFGMEFDSLCDLISFGMAPAVLMFMWVLPNEGRVGWLTAFVFVICGALRLARFNVTESTDSRFFTGLPIPAAAFLCVTWYLFCNNLGLEGDIVKTASIIFIFVSAFLMVSNVKYPCFKKADKEKKIPFNILVSIILTIVLIALEPKITLFVIAFIYLLSGGLIMLRLKQKEAQAVKS